MRKPEFKLLLKKKWNALMFRLGVTETRKSNLIFYALCEMYNSKNRHYHTLHHINDCLELVQAYFKDQVDDLDSLEFAIFFHDIIYCCDVQQRNETSSSAYACGVASDVFGLSQEFTLKVDKLIRATQHLPDYSTTGDESIIVDVDLFALSRDYDAFCADSIRIRREYSAVDDKAFTVGRLGFLKTMLKRRFIYKTDLFRLERETLTRRNIAQHMQEIIESGSFDAMTEF